MKSKDWGGAFVEVLQDQIVLKTQMFLMIHTVVVHVRRCTKKRQMKINCGLVVMFVISGIVVTVKI